MNSDFTKPPASLTSIDLSCDLHLFRISIGEHIFLEDMILATSFFLSVLKNKNAVIYPKMVKFALL